MIEVRPKVCACKPRLDISKLYEIAPCKNMVQLSAIMHHTQLLGGI